MSLTPVAPTVGRVPAATIRQQVAVPMTFPDGYSVEGVVTTFHGLVDGREHLAWTFGTPGDVALVRPHSECLTGDVFGSARCDCGPQLREAVERIAIAGGHLLYLRQEGRGIGLYEKLDAYALQDQGLDTYEANRALGHLDDQRDYRVVEQMLTALGAGGVELLTNNPDKVSQLTALGVDVRGVRATGVHLSTANERYLDAKVRHTNHTISLPLAV
jgi:GTP cyclohydrolase II